MLPCHFVLHIWIGRIAWRQSTPESGLPPLNCLETINPRIWIAASKLLGDNQSQNLIFSKNFSETTGLSALKLILDFLTNVHVWSCDSLLSGKGAQVASLGFVNGHKTLLHNFMSNVDQICYRAGGRKSNELYLCSPYESALPVRLRDIQPQIRHYLGTSSQKLTGCEC